MSYANFNGILIENTLKNILSVIARKGEVFRSGRKDADENEAIHYFEKNIVFLLFFVVFFSLSELVLTGKSGLCFTNNLPVLFFPLNILGRSV